MWNISKKKKNHIILCVFFCILFSLKIPKGVRRIESGEYEKRNGQPVFIIRGFFEHTLNDVRLAIFFLQKN